MEEIISLPPGFRFHPTDEELITYYLGNKVSDFEFTSTAVSDVDLNKSEPWDLPGKASMGEKEWYFFSLKDRKYPTGLRTNRATEAGYWKTTGKDREIYNNRGNNNDVLVIGMKKTLVFYMGRAPKGSKTNWVMHEYRLHNRPAYKDQEWVVCRVFEKSLAVNKKCHQQQQQIDSSPQMSQDDHQQLLIIGDDHDVDLQNFTNNNIEQQLQDHNNLMMNLPATTSTNYSHQLPLMTSPNNINNNISFNSLLLTALQLRGHYYNHHHHRVATLSGNNNNIDYSFMHMPDQAAGENDNNNNKIFDMNMSGSTSRPVLEPPSDQPFNVDSNIW